jgi:hypothetical protein
VAILNDYLTFISGKVPTYTSIPRNLVIDAINNARQQIALWSGCTKTNLTFNLTQGTNLYPLSTIFGSQILTGIISIWCWIGTFKYRLQKGSIGDYNWDYQQYPTTYWIISQSLRVYPTPADNYPLEIYYTYQPTDLQSLTDTDNDIPQVLFQPTGYLASAYTAWADGNAQLGQLYEQMAQQKIGNTHIGRW